MIQKLFYAFSVCGLLYDNEQKLSTRVKVSFSILTIGLSDRGKLFSFGLLLLFVSMYCKVWVCWLLVLIFEIRKKHLLKHNSSGAKY